MVPSKRMRQFGRDALGLAGAASITYGAGLIYHPLEFLMGGIFALAAGIFITLSAPE